MKISPHAKLRYLYFLGALVMACGVFLRPTTGHSQSNQANQPLPALQGTAALEQLKKTGQYDSLQEAMRQARYSVSRAE